MELFINVDPENIFMLLLGSVAYSLAKLYPLLKRGDTFKIKYWLRKNILPHGVATALGMVLLVFISNVPSFIERLGETDIRMVSFFLGVSADFSVYQIEKILELKSNKKDDTETS